MSEADLHLIRLRLHSGERQKAARGELRLPFPAGLTYDPSGGVILDPDEEVQVGGTSCQVPQVAKRALRNALPSQ